jgi:hypothetical protein
VDLHGGYRRWKTNIYYEFGLLRDGTNRIQVRNSILAKKYRAITEESIDYFFEQGPFDPVWLNSEIRNMLFKTIQLPLSQRCQKIFEIHIS